MELTRLKAAIIGYGRMGHEIECALKGRGHDISLTVDENYGGGISPENLRSSGANIAIEFSTPQTAFSNVVTCIEAGIPVVCGTTGWLEHYRSVVELCREKNGAFLYASNFSIAVNMIFRLNEFLARMTRTFPDFDVTIEETHHTGKKDAPSGTAITLAEGIISAGGRKTQWAAGPQTSPEIIGVSSLRRGDVPGIHEVVWESASDVITLAHRAKSRAGFAEGAVLAAEFLCQRRGVFSMDDMLRNIWNEEKQ